MEIPKRRLGKTGIDVTILGLGGEGILRTFGYEKEAHAVINRALDLGVNYFESARAYSGSEAYYGGVLGERRKDIFLTSKSHARDRAGALAHLHETLANMKTDYLDLWQVHDVRTQEDVEEIFAPGGALEAFSEAREKGMVRFVGVTGHHDPFILRQCLEAFPFDTVLMPVNPAEHFYKSFPEVVLPEAQKQDLGIIAMKVYCRGLAANLSGQDSLEPFYRFALTQPVCTAVIGCDDLAQVADNARYARAFEVLGEKETQDLLERVRPYARRLMYYKP